MKTERLLDEIGKIDDKLIEEANNSTLKAKSVKYSRWLKFASAAAVFVIIIGLFISKQYNDFFKLPNKSDANSSPSDGSKDNASSEEDKDDIELSIGTSDLPMLSVNKSFGGGFGYEGYLAFDIDNLKNGNPWNEENDLKFLPVFKNTVEYDAAGSYIDGGLSYEEMAEKAKDIAVKINLNAEVSPKEHDSLIEVTYDDVIIKVDKNGYSTIEFSGNGVQLPDKYSFSYSETSEEEAKDIMQYLLKQYESVIAMESPALDLFGDYDIAGTQRFEYRAYDNSGSLTDRILNYNFNRVNFIPNEDKRLFAINIYSTDLSQKIGDYPIITSEKAKELLLEKKYVSSYAGELPAEKYIAKVELIYRNGMHDKTFMPYYRFLVELPEHELKNGLKDFAAYYVPAVEERYISNMPLWDGSFN